MIGGYFPSRLGHTDGLLTDPLERSPGLLLVEDDAALRQMMVWDLCELGYRVYAVATCREAVDVCTRTHPQLGIVDVRLPDGDGVELAASLMDMLSGLQIVLYTGDRAESARERAPPNCVAVLAKPVSVRRLHSLLQSALDRVVSKQGKSKPPR
jgi:two-component system KDP operon response regulator KdpE